MSILELLKRPICNWKIKWILRF